MPLRAETAIVLTMLVTFVLFILILGLLVFVHELGHFLIAKKNGVTVHEFAFGFKPRLVAWKRGDTTYAINAIPLGGYVQMEGEQSDTGKKGSFASKSPGARFAVLIAGVTMNAILAWVLLTITYAIGSMPLTDTFATHAGVTVPTEVAIANVVPNSPAEQSGLKAGDTIVSVDATPVTDPDQLVDLIKAKAGSEIALAIVRDGVASTVKTTPRLNPPAGEGSLGIAPGIRRGIVKVAWYKAPGAAIQEVGSQISGSVKGFGAFVKQLVVKQEVSEDVTGIIGVGAVTGVVRQLGIGPLLQFVALISTNLAVLNLLPILPLDGGHILFVILEKLRGKPVEDKYKQGVAMAGLAAILLLFVVVSYQDVLRFDILGRIKDIF